MSVISAKDNPLVKQLKRALHQPKRSDATMLLEGVHVAQMLFDSAALPSRVCVVVNANAEIEALKQRAYAAKVRVDVLSDAVFRDLSTLAQGESILCEVSKPLPLPYVGAHDNLLLIDGVQDAGNLGSMLRSAAAAGVRHVVLNNTCVNPFSPKVLRAGAGAHFSLNIVDGAILDEAVLALKCAGVQVLATSLAAKQSLYQANLKQATAWLLGNEGMGVQPALIERASDSVIIPMQAGESLNVAAATAVCLFEMQRQQHQP